MVGDREKTVNLGPLFLASVAFTITVVGHDPWDHHAPHEQAPSRWSSTPRRSHARRASPSSSARPPRPSWRRGSRRSSFRCEGPSMPSRRRVPRELRARFVLLGAEQQHERRCRAASTLPEGHDQASKGEKKTERNEEPGVPPGEGCPSHPLEDAKPLDVAHDSAKEDRHESPIPSDKQPTRQGGAPQPESAQHDKTRGEEEDRHQKSSRSRRLEQRRAVLLRNRHVGPPLPTSLPRPNRRARGRARKRQWRSICRRDGLLPALLDLLSCYHERPVLGHLDRTADQGSVHGRQPGGRQPA